MQGKKLLDRLEELRERYKDFMRSEALKDSEPLTEDQREELEGLSDAEPLDDSEAEELSDLERIENEISRHSYLIAEEDFEGYARELAEDLGKDISSWPHSCIDWEKAANELSHDFTVIEIGGATYYVRD